MSKSALLICNGEPPSVQLARKLASQVDFIVAADGGANAARRLGIRPHVIMGDLDSITASTKRFFAGGKGLKPLHGKDGGRTRYPRPEGRGHTQVIQVKRQDNTDLEKALDYLRTKRINNVTIIGAAGKRIDFTLGNLSVLWNYVPSMTLTVVGDRWKAMPVESGKKIAANPGTTVSLIPFGACSGITLKGLKYPLTNATMKIGEIGVSNVVKRSPFSVTIRRGKMLLFIMGRT